MVNELFKKVNTRKWDKKINSLIKSGAYIGKNVAWFSKDITIDSTRPWLIHIGDYTKITKGVVILTHDYSLSVLRRVYGEWIGEGQETYIGDNCFIGMNSILLMGAHIGNNCIVGAGSVVHGSFPDNVVIAGNPARVICTLEEHYKKRKGKSPNEAKECAKIIKKRLNRNPTPEDLIGFKFLFTPRDDRILEEYGIPSFQCKGDEPNEIREQFFNSEPYWVDFDTFLKEALQE